MNFFYDTCSLLNLQTKVFDTSEKFYISSVSLSELENIKNSRFKDEEIKYKAREVGRLLKKYENSYEIIFFNKKIERCMKKLHLPPTEDSKILASAYYVSDAIFVTEDLLCYHLAKSIDLPVVFGVQGKKENYTGFKEVTLNESGLTAFYGCYGQNDNFFNLLENQYLIINFNNQVVGKYKWKDNQYIEIPYQKAESKLFGKITPKNGDVYQQLALDSLSSNQITMLRGNAGSGKTMLAFAYMFSLLEKGKIDKIVIFCNTVATKGAAKLGYYPGTRTDKMLDSQIGNLLESKLGSRIMVEKMIEDGQLILLPMSDIRGFDTTGMNACVYLSEAQNLDIELMRLALQRIGTDSICIIDGDASHQVDLDIYAGDRNGMRRVSEVFRGKQCYGEIELQNIYRSEIAKIAEEL